MGLKRPYFQCAAHHVAFQAHKMATYGPAAFIPRLKRPISAVI